MRLLRFAELKPLGICFSRVHLDRLQKAGKFPRKIKIGANTASYLESEIMAWIDARCAERDGGKAA
ncbi:MAG: AlpA family phage regulatory protein [Burkholderiaceae bacterium]